MIKDQEILKKLNDDFILPEHKEAMEQSAVRLALTLQYKKQKKGTKVYCPVCNEYTTCPNEEFKQIYYTKQCPKCFREFNKLSKANERANTYIEYFQFSQNTKGYQVRFTFKFGKLPYNYNIKLVYREIGKKEYVRGIYITGCYYYSTFSEVNEYSRWKKDEWRKVSGHTYGWRFSVAHKNVFMNKKQWLEEFAKFVIKSNQKEMIIKNSFTQDQIKAIVMFNLKKPEEVYRNRVWIRKNNYSLKTKELYTSATLDYLHKNEISMSDYEDYEVMCKQLNRKVDRPKDFKLWHDRLSQMLEVQKNKDYQKLVERAFKRLSKNTYKKNDITIKAFENVEEICYVSSHLHNCMSRLYIKPYAKGITDLYYLSVNDKPIVAIEVKNGKLIQCRADNNATPDAIYTKLVNKWCREYC